ncbi:MAG TPA: type II toxin-antitoxin system prevent-host-death family antitoxin [Chloroflexi bacterium]|nr:type II toxin-antitoxin system prevent-host-death family antitoxin [Chloroflexota bacterium]
MPEIGIRQLKNEASEIIRSIREQKTEYIITVRGEPVAVLRPLSSEIGDVDTILNWTADVFSGLSETDLAEIEASIRRRPDFFGGREVDCYFSRRIIPCLTKLS